MFECMIDVHDSFCPRQWGQVDQQAGLYSLHIVPFWNSHYKPPSLIPCPVLAFCIDVEHISCPSCGSICPRQCSGRKRRSIDKAGREDPLPTANRTRSLSPSACTASTFHLTLKPQLSRVP